MADRVNEVAAHYGLKLMAEFGLTAVQVAGLLGNLAHESGRFTVFKEIGSGPNSGGRGWAQWSGQRRLTFLGYAAAHRLDPKSDEASYGYLCVEFHGAYKSVITALKRCVTVESAATTVEKLYEAAGRPMMSSRIAFARRILAILSPGHPASVAPPARRSARAPMAKKRTRSRHHRHA
ncbi:phage tail tip lysozyme [Methylobacterium persicinum]|uniref:Phage tail lysozyme domain-containing protein n=1 Tax=Methylobacterium persicinum TaxID=374426 RepID=A0ABU0HSE3_9HYPH|nr:phage tail tip lysozyme [Methylobacterium persicinum]MDQ0445230.1 hypothetical protein [Methylobacterium persicinum]GJE37855.1 hypothetical protein KHHGKMAE_1917 [Methylobacterium persicinum]